MATSQDSSMDNVITEYESDDSSTQLRTPSRDPNSKREDYIAWEDYFMALAFLSAKRSKDPVTQVGACIVNQEKKIVGLGYNGFPIGCHDDKFPWRKGAKDDLASKNMYVCHAEMNAIVNKISADVKGCTIYVSMHPCAECAKIIIQSGIKKVFYKSDKNTKKPEVEAAQLMFKAAKVEFKQYSPKSKIEIDFDEIDRNNEIQLPASPRHIALAAVGGNRFVVAATRLVAISTLQISHTSKSPETSHERARKLN
ncbi:hypothetical protein B566_EDAN004619 [Ephemera danica]|nr:hypothetical protein B566_EDAN004619 [Ephemera danica]